MYTIEEIRENYKGFSDSKIVNIAKKESKGLQKEVVVILNDEIKKRNLDLKLIRWVNTETKNFEGIERTTLFKKIQQLQCPKCSEKKDCLYGFETNQIIAVVLFSNHTRNEQILCLSCGIKEKTKALLITFFAGWWSKRTFLLTPWILLKDSFNFLCIDSISDKIVNRLITEKTGYFRRNGTENNTLKKVIKDRNIKHIPEDNGYDFT